MVAAVILAGICPTARATTIVLKGGGRYENAEVLTRTASRWQLKTRFGLVAVPVSSIASVDGRPLTPPAPPPPVPTVTPEPSPPPEEVFEVLPEATPEEPEVIEPTPTPDESTPEPTQVATATPLAAPTPMILPTERRDPKLDMLLVIAGGLFLLWAALLVWVQRDLVERGRASSGWNTVVALLPGIGFVAYLVARFLQKPGAASAQNRAMLEGQGFFQPGSRAAQSINLQFMEEDRSVFGGDLEEGTGLEFARQTLEQAIVQRASDIHFEPQEGNYRVRFRVDGVLAEVRTFGRAEGMRVVSALKTLAEIDVAEKRKAQDGRFRVKTDLREVDFRVATANSIFGEKLVIRILDRKGGLFDLSAVGMAPEMMERFHRAIHSRAGMIIVTGPTGSGKTSTLYAALSKLDAAKLNIMTIEDPAEYELPGATQIPVNVKAGVTYEAGLRSLLRQDPDVIFVGEMRDAEAAKIALRAALTGHLVFTTLHTKDALATVTRLEEMGVERSQLSSGLLMLVAQRLVRVLCEHCREPYPAKGDELVEVGVVIPEGATLYRPRGCGECNQMGYLGRTGIFELVILDDEMRGAIARGAGHEDLLEMAAVRGFVAYRQHGAEKALAGVTSIEEVLEAT